MKVCNVFEIMIFNRKTDADKGLKDSQNFVLKSEKKLK